MIAINQRRKGQICSAKREDPRFICDTFVGEHHLPIGESAASFISRVGAVAHTPD